MKHQKKSLSEEENTIIQMNEFREMISICVIFGDLYNPGNEELKIENLHNIEALATEKLKELKNKKEILSAATEVRIREFKEMTRLTSRIMDLLEVQEKELVIAGNEFFQTSSVIFSSEKTVNVSADVMRLSHANFNNFNHLIISLQQIKNYDPDEKELTIFSLQDKLHQLEEKNSLLIMAYTSYYTTLNEKDNILKRMSAVFGKVGQYLKSMPGDASTH